ncbi:ATP-binding protein [Mesorhizobium sp. M0898]
MIAAAMQGAHGRPRQRAAHGYHWHASSKLPELDSKSERHKRLRAAKKLLLADWRSRKGCNSSTYGKDDILTLSWHADLFAHDRSTEDLIAVLTALILKRCESILGSDGHAEPSRALNDGFKTGERMSGSTFYILLRFVRCLRTLPAQSDEGSQAVRKKLLKKAFERFQEGIREHLSYGDVGDSRFDACELAFCLEGMLHTRPETVDEATAERVFKIIHAAQERTGSWRPQTPLTTSHRGEVLYAIGIETATSLLCSLSILDARSPGRRSNALGNTHLAVILKYWDWLKGRRLPLSLAIGEVMGWRSERLGGSYLHIWENSQILEFLVIFRDYLDQHISGELLELSELDVTLPVGTPPAWNDIVTKFEPAGTNPDYRFYEDIGRCFVEPRLTRSGEPNWSMLLYGPPGTGKSTTAKNLAAALNVPMIRVTVSDFLTTGDAHMERRAKLIFEVLRHQMMAVVLFDELDQFLLDRDSELFRAQQSAFQLLTPGMLTKLADLREEESVIFILATNYDDRIDSAIKRPGRVDVSYLCLPPDFSKRCATIKRVLKKREITASDGEIRAAARVAVFLGHTSIERIAKQTASALALAERYDKEPRDIQFNTFSQRAVALIDAGKAPDELIGLTWMALEAMPPRGARAPRFVERLASLLTGLDASHRDRVREGGEFSAAQFDALVALGKVAQQTAKPKD